MIALSFVKADGSVLFWTGTKPSKSFPTAVPFSSRSKEAFYCFPNDEPRETDSEMIQSYPELKGTVRVQRLSDVMIRS